MGFYDFFELPVEDKRRAFQAVSQRNLLPPFAVEKDWWVSLTLTLLFESPWKDFLVFKGGTSLSKAWRVIERFSEDIDLALDRRYLGFEGEVTKTQVRKLREKSHRWVVGELFPYLEKQFASLGYTVTVELAPIASKDQEPIQVNIYYPTHMPVSTFVSPRVQVEVGSRSLREPFVHRQIQSLLGEAFPGQGFSDVGIAVATAIPERTFWEKMLLLHEEFQKPLEKIRVNRLSRHLYDLVALWEHGYGSQALTQEGLFWDIVRHRARFTPVKEVEYAQLSPSTILPLPPEAVAAAWARDYEIMRQEMIYGASLDFEALLAQVKGIQEECQQLGWQGAF